MNTAIPYGLAFALLTLILARLRYWSAAEGMATMTAGLAAFAPFVAWSPMWGAAGLVIWTAVAVRFHFLHMRGKANIALPMVGYAMAQFYMATLAGYHDWPVWGANALGILMVAIICGPPARDLLDRLRTAGSAFVHRWMARRRGMAAAACGHSAIACSAPSREEMAGIK